MEEIVITVSSQAEVKVEVKGHQGPGCHTLSREIERSLGETIKDEPTREMHETANEHNRARYRH